MSNLRGLRFGELALTECCLAKLREAGRGSRRSRARTHVLMLVVKRYLTSAKNRTQIVEKRGPLCRIKTQISENKQVAGR